MEDFVETHICKLCVSDTPIARGMYLYVSDTAHAVSSTRYEMHSRDFRWVGLRLAGQGD